MTKELGSMETLKQSMKNIYGFQIVEEDGKQSIKLPEAVMPEFVKERIRFFTKYREDGMNFFGCLNCILAYDEEEWKKEFAFGAYEEWLPVTEEFKQWRDTYHADRGGEVAVAILYGTCEEVEHDD
ncbi:hypothetical protein [Candidatus Enterococcus clewellii]|uniref:Phage protein n=1 Tax=Candidatus Enterococcus clewellii TaxID=1834193 RepID=A0A242K876_9ENTE|nr:hypothetical protein [Enterococcus sp. 9E7_DIV0242]OTP17267.1 hypothetical protein A5888_001405 [Enterococcus sp. 9E7_DIV0242]